MEHPTKATLARRACPWLAVLAVACSADERGASGAGRGGGGASEGGAGDGAGLGGGAGNAAGGGIVDGNACVQQQADASLQYRPVDIVFVIDNSGSMGKEIEGVVANVNDSFASIIAASGIDYRVIMLTRHGELGDQNVCIGGTLSPAADCATARSGDMPALNEPVFFHYDDGVGSTDSWCKLLEAYDRPDRHGLAPDGLQQWLRAEAFQVFVEISDDGVDCGDYNDRNDTVTAETMALEFDSALLSLPGGHFGNESKRDYVWHSIVALGENTPAADPWLPTDPVIGSECATAAAPGMGHQALSNLTGGLKFPVCEGNMFDAVFERIAEGVVEDTTVACDFAIPDAPEGEALDLSTVEVSYTPSSAAAQVLRQTADPSQCDDASFYIDGDSIQLCPDTCEVVQADSGASVEVLFGCALPYPI